MPPLGLPSLPRSLSLKRIRSAGFVDQNAGDALAKVWDSGRWCDNRPHFEDWFLVFCRHPVHLPLTAAALTPHGADPAVAHGYG